MSNETAPTKGARLNIEWVSLVYLLFFVLAVMSPSIVDRGFFGLQESSVEEILILSFGLAGLLTFVVYNRIMESRLKERDEAIDSADRAKKELIESYKYIGSVNRRIDLLQKLANQTSLTLVDANTYTKDLLESLVANAATAAGSPHALLRFVDLERLRTETETHHALDGKPLVVANKDLKLMHDRGESSAILTTASGRLIAVPSDRRNAGVRAFLAVELADGPLDDVEVSLLRVFANQAELVHQSLSRERKGTPLAEIDRLTDQSKGEVG